MKRSPAVAGMFYPASPSAIRKMVEGFLNEAKPEDLPELKAIIVPHAGYIYSGSIAGSAYAQIERNVPAEKRKNIILIGPAHFGLCEAAVGNYVSLISPLGEVPVNREMAGELERLGVKFDEEVHRPEHSLEVQLPFIQTVSSDSQVVPILLGTITPDQMAEILDPYFIRPDCFFIISSDLSHYLPYNEAVNTDKNSLTTIKNLDLTGERQVDACGRIGILTLMRLCKKHGYKMKVLDYRNSGDTAGDKSAVVGYAAVAAYKKE